MSDHLQVPRCVGLNAHLLSLGQTYRGAGINGYIHQILRHLPEVAAADTDLPPLELTAYLHAPGFTAPTGLAVECSRWDTRNPWRRILWEQTCLAVISRRLALLHGLAFATPLAAASPTVVTVHDLSFLRFPEAFRPFNRLYLSFITRVSVRRAARVIAISESTGRDVIRYYGTPADKVSVVPMGVTEEFHPAPPPEVTEFRRRKGLPDRFILFIGTLEPRKNLVRLIDAFARWQRDRRGPTGKGGSQETKLVIAGAKGWSYDRIFARVAELGLTDSVIFAGYVPVEELPWWYRAARVFVYPSLYEGFGLPVLEAMACGTPTITSTSSSLPEVVGGGPADPDGPSALLVDPENTEALADAIDQILTDDSLATRLRAAGLRRAAQFSWTRTARETVKVYRDALRLPNAVGTR